MIYFATCPTCSTSLQPDDRWCPECGTAITSALSESSACPSCRQHVAHDDEWCPECGTRLTSTVDLSASQSQAGVVQSLTPDSVLQPPTIPLLHIGGAMPKETAAVDMDEASINLVGGQNNLPPALPNTGTKAASAHEAMRSAGNGALQAVADTKAGQNLKNYWVGWALVGAVLIIGLFTVNAVIGASQQYATLTTPQTFTAQQSSAIEYTSNPVLPVVQTKRIVCPACTGQGHFSPVRCSFCSGMGRITDPFGDTHSCSTCAGTGFESRGGTCSLCNGSGRVTEDAAAQWQALQQQNARNVQAVQSALQERNTVRTFRCKNCYTVRMMTEDQRWRSQPDRDGACPKGRPSYPVHEWERVP